MLCFLTTEGTKKSNTGDTEAVITIDFEVRLKRCVFDSGDIEDITTETLGL